MIIERGSQRREKVADTDYMVICTGQKVAVLQDIYTGKLEKWGLNDHHSGYTIEIKGKGYEFISTLAETGVH